jgi:hypothetical protein
VCVFEMRRVACLLFQFYILIKLVLAEQKSPVCDSKNLTSTCKHCEYKKVVYLGGLILDEFFSLYRSPRCCEYEPSVCCYQIPDTLLVTLIIASGLGVLFLCGWIISCCMFCCCGKKSST